MAPKTTRNGAKKASKGGEDLKVRAETDSEATASATAEAETETEAEEAPCQKRLDHRGWKTQQPTRQLMSA